MSKCNYCNAEIIFIKTTAGKHMSCEIDKIKVWRLLKGKKKAVAENGEVFRCETEFTPFIGSEIAYIPHWGNCPGAEQARKRK